MKEIQNNQWIAHYRTDQPHFGLERMVELLALRGNPHLKLKVIHIGGTNGKGSTIAFLKNMLEKMGLRVGVFSSPYLIHYTDQISINGESIPKAKLEALMADYQSLLEGEAVANLQGTTEFEIITAIAYDYFASEQVDVAIMEVGMGGLLDSTNVCQPILTGITTIGLDHVALLGDTLEAIAEQKAGIIKHRVPVVIGESVPETQIVFKAKAQKEDALIVFAEDIPAILSSRPHPDGGIAYQTRFFGDIVGELGGSYQEKNANTVLTAVMQLYNKGVIKNAESIAKGFANVCELTGLMGRWQKLQTNPLVICDTGHNVGGWTYLSQQIKRQQCAQKRIVFGMVDDKDLHAVMSMLPDDAIYYWTQPSTHRAFPAEKVAATANDYDLHGIVFPTVLEAYQAALQDADEQDFIFVGGSSYVVADLLTSLQKK